MAPIDDAVVFFGSGGSDAVDTAAKLVRRYWDVARPAREAGHRVARARLSRDARLGHGARRHPRQQGGLRRRDHRGGRHGRRSTTPRPWARCSSGAASRSPRSSASRSSGRVASIPPEPSYWAEVQRLCREHDVLLIADEVITGFGRTGSWWGSQRYAIEPDIITFAKGVTSGYQPAGRACWSVPRVAAPFWDGQRARADVRPRLHVLRACRRLRRSHGQPRHPRSARPWSTASPRSSRYWTPLSAGCKLRRSSARSGPWA